MRRMISLSSAALRGARCRDRTSGVIGWRVRELTDARRRSRVPVRCPDRRRRRTCRACRSRRDRACARPCRRRPRRCRSCAGRRRRRRSRSSCPSQLAENGRRVGAERLATLEHLGRRTGHRPVEHAEQRVPSDVAGRLLRVLGRHLTRDRAAPDRLLRALVARLSLRALRRRRAAAARHLVRDLAVDLGRVDVERDRHRRREPAQAPEVVPRQRLRILGNRADDQQQREKRQRHAERVAAAFAQIRAEPRPGHRRRGLGGVHVERDLAARHANPRVRRQRERRLGVPEVGAQRQHLHGRLQLGVHRGREVDREAARDRLDQRVAAGQRRGRRQVRRVHRRVGATRRADGERTRLVRAQQAARQRNVAEARLDEQRRRGDDDARLRERQLRRQPGVLRRRAARIHLGRQRGLRARETRTRAVDRLHVKRPPCLQRQGRRVPRFRWNFRREPLSFGAAAPVHVASPRARRNQARAGETCASRRSRKRRSVSLPTSASASRYAAAASDIRPRRRRRSARAAGNRW